MKNPFAKKARDTKLSGAVCSATRAVCDSRQLNSQLKIIFPRKSNHRRETDAEFAGSFVAKAPLDDGVRICHGGKDMPTRHSERSEESSI